MRQPEKLIFPKNKRIGFLAIICSVLATAGTAFFRMQRLYRQVPQYEELVTGYTSWIAYFKQGDMTLAYHVIFGIAGFYLVFSALFNVLSRFWPFLQKEAEEKQIGEKGKKVISEASELFFLLVFTQFSFGVAGRGITILFPSVYDVVCRIFFPAQLLLAGIMVFLWIRWKRDGNAEDIEKCFFWSQLPLPLIFPEITYYEYSYQGNILTQYFSVPFFVMEAIISFLMIIFIIFHKKNISHKKVYLSSFLSLAVFASYQLPGGTISGTPLEFYHYGELSVPLHQLLKFGTVPYLDTMPIHGFCDYFQAGIWYTLFDGTYASFEAAMVIGCVVIAVITAVIYYYFTESKALALLCVLLFSLFGDQYYYVRWAFVMPFLLIVFSKQAREDFAKMLWYWTFLSILSIAWNPSIGGACALAALPMILYKGFAEKGYLRFVQIWKERTVQKRWIVAYAALLILGICFIPMFFAILRYIVENSAAILETTGDILKEELQDPYVWYATFGFVLSMVISFYFCIQKKGEMKKLALFGTAFLLLFNGIIVKYTFVRTQYGERGIIAATVCSLFLILMILLPYIKRTWSREGLLLLFGLLAVTAVTKGANLFTMPQRLFERETISEEYEYISGEEIGIPSLGNLFITEDLKEELIALNYIANDLCKDQYQFVDMTNQLAHYNILDKKVLLPFSSTYNTNNEVMQKKAIEVLDEKKPEVIVVSPEWKHDSGTLSTRNYHLYQWLMQNDYVPCKYESILFFTNTKEIEEAFDSAYEEMGACMHLENIKKLPTVWSSEQIEEKYTQDMAVNVQLADTNSLILTENMYRIETGDTYFMYIFETPISGKDMDFLRIKADFGENEEVTYEGVVYFMEEGKGIRESKRFIYDGGAKEVLIPLSTSPYWSYGEKIQTIMINFIGDSLTGKQVKLELEFEKYTGIGEERK